MTTTHDRARRDKSVREGNAAKRAAILAAARHLFLDDGVASTSMDAVAARAAVSKRTVYDYFGDKHGLLLAVVIAASESLVGSLQRALDDHLADSEQIVDQARLEQAFTAFAVDICDRIIASSDYAATFRLIRENTERLPELADHPITDAPEQAVAERIAHYADIGLLDAPDPRRAADHFNALTSLLAADSSKPIRAGDDRLHELMGSGVQVFMRAYGRRDHERGD